MFVVVAAAACLALGWWQWGRFESTAGSARNLGYAMQWPLFAVAFIWGYRRFVQLEDEAELEDRMAAEEEAAAAGDGTAASAQRAKSAASSLTAIPEGFLPSRPAAASPADDGPEDAAHAEYNRLLAELAANDTPRTDTAKEKQ
ncbi:hypothetical protein GCM10009551_078750 [Nocardiopsis tropica]|nr:hypothetical protein TTY48_42100 [Tsukamurella sp. TY48]